MWQVSADVRAAAPLQTMTSQHTVLFVCQFNSARSQLAEGLARSLAPDGMRVLSAGLERTIVNAEVSRALREVGLDPSAQYSKSMAEVAGEPVDEVIVLSDRALEEARRCFPHALLRTWFMDDPVADPADVPAAVRSTRDALTRRLREWLNGGGA